MNGLINLVGSGEYLPVMKDVDRYLLDSLNVNGRKPRVVCLPTAAGKEGDSSVNRWSNMGIQHFTELGAEVNAARIIDQESANDPHCCLLYTSPSPRDRQKSRMPSSA